MDKKEIYEIMVQSKPDAVKELAEKLEKKYTFEITRKPETGLLMFRAEESVEHLHFNVGEILVTSAEVRLDNALGYSMVMGGDKNFAFYCALIMTALEAELPETKEIEALAHKLKKDMEAELRKEQKIIASTRVNFEVMGGQDPGVMKNMGINKE